MSRVEGRRRWMRSVELPRGHNFHVAHRAATSKTGDPQHERQITRPIACHLPVCILTTYPLFCSRFAVRSADGPRGSPALRTATPFGAACSEAATEEFLCYDCRHGSVRETQGELVIRTIAMPADTNPSGDIFGWIVSRMDLGSGILAAKVADVVTVAIEGMSFSGQCRSAIGSPVMRGWRRSVALQW